MPHHSVLRFSQTMLVEPAAQLHVPCTVLGPLGLVSLPMLERSGSSRSASLSVLIEREEPLGVRSVFSLTMTGLQSKSPPHRPFRPTAWGRFFSRIWISGQYMTPSRRVQSRSLAARVLTGLNSTLDLVIRSTDVTLVTPKLTRPECSQLSVWLSGCEQSRVAVDWVESSFKQNRGSH